MVFYCERAAGFCNDVTDDDEGYFDALVRMFEQALQFANALPVDRRDALIARLERVRVIGHEFGYGVGDEMDFSCRSIRTVEGDGSELLIAFESTLRVSPQKPDSGGLAPRRASRSVQAVRKCEQPFGPTWRASVAVALWTDNAAERADA
jgi:hypothetical protein